MPTSTASSSSSAGVAVAPTTAAGPAAGQLLPPGVHMGHPSGIPGGATISIAKKEEEYDSSATVSIERT